MDPRQVYRRFSPYYDAYVGDFADDVPLYLNFLADTDRVLEVGCGSGRLLKPICNVSSQVTGIDISEEMLNLARQALAEPILEGRLLLLNHDLADCALEGAYDRIFVTFYMFNYLLTDADADRFLANIRTLMNGGGLLAMDMFYPVSLQYPALAGQWREGAVNAGLSLIPYRDCRYMDGSLETRIQIYDAPEGQLEIKTTRIFRDKEEMIGRLHRAGFREIQICDRYDYHHLHDFSPREKTSSSYVIVASN